MAQLVILSGETTERIAKLLPFMTEREQVFVLSEFPELLGSATVAAVATGIAAISSTVIGAVAAKRRAEREAAKTAELINAQNEAVEKQTALQQVMQAAEKRRTLLIMGALAGTGVILFFVIKKKKKSRRN